MIFMGPGSPTYAIRHLRDSLAWDVIRARHRLGAALIFASAATISISAHALPVYEIYKVGQDVHVVDGLNFFADFGLHITFIPHWNNVEGGADLDTSRCFIGMERFVEWSDLLPPENETVGLDEHTGLILDLESDQCEVNGVSSVSLVRECDPEVYPASSKFPLSDLGDFVLPDPLHKGIPAHVWEMVINAPPLEGDRPPEHVIGLAEARLNARVEKDWAESDRLRDEISAHKGTPEGDWVSMAVPSDGSYGIPAGVIYGYPVTCSGGDYKIVQGLAINDFSRGRMDATYKELLEERDGVKDLL